MKRKILITGATGYIGKRLIPILVAKGYELVCCVRDLSRVSHDHKMTNGVTYIEVDFLKKETLDVIPKDITEAYYLMHSMTNTHNFESLEKKCALNFNSVLENTTVKQVIYLSGIVNDKQLSKHLDSRFAVENILKSGRFALTVFRAGIIVGSGSASFEIIRDLVEKLPLMITPKWLNTPTQPIAIRDVLLFLTRAIGKEEVYNKSYDIFGPEVLTYKQLLLQFAEVRNLKRFIYALPVMTPRLSSYWLYFVTSTSYTLATNLVDSMKVSIIGKSSSINEILSVEPITYKNAVKKAFEKIAQNHIVSSWKDAMISGNNNQKLTPYINVPSFGCFKDIRAKDIINEGDTINKIWQIGGTNGWYFANSLWRIRGILDIMLGGIGIRRGRRDPKELQAGDALDFWRVLCADKKAKRLLLFAEMKLPGEAWLEFKIVKNKLYQRAVFRPKGVLGRLYWFAVIPFHELIFRGLIKQLVK